MESRQSDVKYIKEKLTEVKDTLEIMRLLNSHLPQQKKLLENFLQSSTLEQFEKLKTPEQMSTYLKTTFEPAMSALLISSRNFEAVRKILCGNLENLQSILSTKPCHIKSAKGFLKLFEGKPLTDREILPLLQLDAAIKEKAKEISPSSAPSVFSTKITREATADFCMKCAMNMTYSSTYEKLIGHKPQEPFIPPSPSE